MDLPPEINTQTSFAIKKGSNLSDRIVPDLLEQIAKLINNSTIWYNNDKKKLKVLGEVRQGENGQWRLIFDVKEPCKELAHVEFTISKTGWEMCLIEDQTTNK